jgi:hypothetical protein
MLFSECFKDNCPHVEMKSTIPHSIHKNKVILDRAGGVSSGADCLPSMCGGKGFDPQQCKNKKQKDHTSTMSRSQRKKGKLNKFDITKRHHKARGKSRHK